MNCETNKALNASCFSQMSILKLACGIVYLWLTMSFCDKMWIGDLNPNFVIFTLVIL